MDERENILCALKQSNKGRLKYDKDWFERGKIEDMLETCTSPPKVNIPSGDLSSDKDVFSSPCQENRRQTTVNYPQSSKAIIERTCKLRTYSLRPISQSTPGPTRDVDLSENATDDTLSLSPISFCPISPKTNNILKKNPKKMKSNIINSGRRLLDDEERKGDVLSKSREGDINSDVKKTVKQSARLSTDTVEGSNDMKLQNDKNSSEAEKRKEKNKKSKHNNDDSIGLEVSIEANKTELEIRELEENLKRRVKEKVELKRKSLQEFSESLRQQTLHDSLQLDKQTFIKAQSLTQQAQQACLAPSEELEQRQQKLRERHKEHAKMLAEKMSEAQARKLALLEQERKKKLDRLNALRNLNNNLKATSQLVDEKLATCKNQELLPEMAKKCKILMQTILNHGSKILSEAEKGEPSSRDVQKMQDLHSSAGNALEHLTIMIEETNRRATELEEKAAEEAAKAAAAKPPPVSQTAASSASSTAQNTLSSTLQSTGDEIVCVFPDSFSNYTRLQELLKETAKNCEEIINNSQFKKIKFNLSKAVNIPVNAIAPTSGSHLRDKLQRLLKLMEGQTVDIGSRSTISAGCHPSGLLFCKELLAKKIVKQGDEQVSSNPESAFAIAAVTVAIWAGHADFGDLLLAHFYKECPYLVPYYIPKQAGQSSEDYHKSLGYIYTDGVIEKQDKFLRRMSGMMRLYASMLVSKPVENKPHPHGIDHAWAWLTRIMNIEPFPDITATMIHDMLQVTGNMLNQTYKKQFIKLLMTLIVDFMPKIKAVTLSGSGGPYTRLQIFLEKTISEKKISPPEGMLPTNFWIT